jgi:DNA-binding transcriptional MerR regulator
MAAPRGEPVQEFFSIGDVCALTDLKPHVLRYWESQFKLLNPAKNRSGNRVYARREVELIQLVKHLLYTEKYTIDGARQKLEEFRKGGAVRPAARAALEVEMLESVERDLLDLMQFLADPAGLEAGTDAAAPPGVSRAS